LRDVVVPVKARTEEDVVEWMHMVERVLSIDHRKRNPQCVPDTLSEVKIPMTHSDRIGGAPTH